MLNKNGLQVNVVDQVRTLPVVRPLDLVAIGCINTEAPGDFIVQFLRHVAIERRSQLIIGFGLGEGFLLLVFSFTVEQGQTADDIGVGAELGDRAGIEKTDSALSLMATPVCPIANAFCPCNATR